MTHKRGTHLKGNTLMSNKVENNGKAVEGGGEEEGEV